MFAVNGVKQPCVCCQVSATDVAYAESLFGALSCISMGVDTPCLSCSTQSRRKTPSSAEVTQTHNAKADRSMVGLTGKMSLTYTPTDHHRSTNQVYPQFNMMSSSYC